jgi:hypothetical protein
LTISVFDANLVLEKLIVLELEHDGVQVILVRLVGVSEKLVVARAVKRVCLRDVPLKAPSAAILRKV